MHYSSFVCLSVYVNHTGFELENGTYYKLKFNEFSDSLPRCHF